MKKFVGSEEQFRLIEEQVHTLAHEVMASNPDTPPAILAEKITSAWHTRPADADQINLLAVKPALCFLIGFRGEEKKIFLEI